MLLKVVVAPLVDKLSSTLFVVVPPVFISEGLTFGACPV